MEDTCTPVLLSRLSELIGSLKFWHIWGVRRPTITLKKNFRNLSRLFIHSVIFIWDRFQFNCANQCCTSLLNRFSFVWNRTKSVFADSSEIPASAVLEDLSKCAERSPDVIVEVAHPSITKEVYRIESYLVEQSSTRCVGWSVTWVGLTLIWMFHHLAQLPSRI